MPNRWGSTRPPRSCATRVIMASRCVRIRCVFPTSLRYAVHLPNRSARPRPSPGTVEVGEAHPLHRVEVIEIAPVFLEAVLGRQRFGGVAHVVLAELAGAVAEIVKELGKVRRAGSQKGRAAGNFR